MRRYNRVIILCPANVVTGGTEALHQLCHCLIGLGQPAGILYFSTQKNIRIIDQKITTDCTTGQAYLAFQKYKIETFFNIPIENDDIIILPEILAHLAESKITCNKAIWWLSVDNAFDYLPSLKYLRMPQPIFQDRDIIHFYQSAYARQFLIANGVKKLHPLYDFTNLEDFYTNASNVNRIYDIALYPRKGGGLAQKYLERNPLRNYFLVENLSKQEVAAGLSRSKLYVDFGNQPGKDRVPREAALSGAIIFLHAYGAGSYFEDCPLDDSYLFTESDVITGNLNLRIELVLENLEHNQAQQSLYRNQILNEMEEFSLQVRKFFT